MLRLFLRVAGALSFSEAARLENVSQPALSRTIRLLEDQLGARLFDRDTRNVMLTPAGAELVPIAERLIGDYDLAFADLAQAFAGQRGRIAVGALPSVAAVLLPDVLARFAVERPKVEVKVLDSLSGSLMQRLVEGRIDLAFTIAPGAAEPVSFEPLFADDCLLVCRRGDPLDRPEPIDWTALAAERFIAMSPDSSVRRMTDLGFQSAGLDPAPLYECAQVVTVRGLVRAGLGVTALPATAVAMMDAPDLACRPLKPAFARSIGVARRAARSLPPAAEAFIACFKAAFPPPSIALALAGLTQGPAEG